MPNEECPSTFTATTLTLRCTRHLRGNPFRGEEFKHSAEWNNLIWTWTTREDDQHDTA